jgi:hypothetical protein
MVWIPKKSRRAGSKSTVHPNDCNSGTRTLRSCLRVGPDEKLVVNHHTTDSVVDRDHSVRSARSVLSVISGSGSSKSRDTSGSDEQAKSSESGGSGESLISGGRCLSKDSRHSPIISSVSEDRKSVRFGVVAIREHERAVGDHPCCSTGPPIGYVEMMCVGHCRWRVSLVSLRCFCFVCVGAELDGDMLPHVTY